MIKVSVVVPIYKVENYLRECIDSILDQTLKDIEVILVDDGSPDDCPRIVDEYAKKDKRIVVVHQENSGYSAAVNRGIEMARGEYIGIIESDDWIEPDMYEKLYEDAKKYNTDITKGMFTSYDSTEEEGVQDIVYRNPAGVDLSLAPDGAFKLVEWPKIIAFHASIWSSIYRAKFVKKIKIPETAGASYQDFPFMVEVVTKAKRISVVRKPLVHWRNEPGQGNSTSANGKKLLLMGKNSLLAKEIVEEAGIMPRVQEEFYAQAFWANFSFFLRIKMKYRKEYLADMKELMGEAVKDKNIQFKYLSKKDRVFLRFIMKHNYVVVNCAIFLFWIKGKIVFACRKLMGW